MPMIAPEETGSVTKEFANKMANDVPKIVINESGQIADAVPEDLFVSCVVNAVRYQGPLQPR